MKWWFQKTVNQTELLNILSDPDIPVFDKKYKATVTLSTSYPDVAWIDWINRNTSSRSVDIKLLGDKIYIAFEDENDALIFKIKYL